MMPGALLLENVHESWRPRICIYVGFGLSSDAYDYLVYDSFFEKTYMMHSTVDITEFGWDEIT